MPPFKKGKITQDELISQICELYHVEDYESKINYSLAVKRYQPEKKEAIVSDIFSTVLYIIGEDGIDAEKIEEIRQSVSAKSYIDDETWDMVEKAFRGVVVGVNAAVAADYYGNVGKVEGGSKSFKFSDMTESEIVKIVEEYRKRAPIEIPDTAKYKAKSMVDGYEQISYKWNDRIYKYEVRWHTRTSGAPKGQGNTWVIQRTIPGNGMMQ